MNSKIRKLNLEKLLFIDAEFIRGKEKLEIDTTEFNLYQKKLRNRETGDYPEALKVQDHYEINGGLDPVFNKVVSVVVGFLKGDTFFYKKIEGTQKEILEGLYNILSTTGLIPCGHNIIGFDLPTLRLKAFQENVDMSLLPEKFNDSQKKPWNMSDAVFDTMEITKGTYFYNLSLDAMCYLAGIESPKDDIDGSQVSDVYYNEGLERISDYCVKDVLAVARVMRYMQGKSTDLKVIERKDEVKEETSLLEKLYTLNAFTNEIKDGIEELIGKKKLTKKDKENLFVILRGVYVRDDFENKDQDSKAVIAEKEEEIREFINYLD